VKILLDNCVDWRFGRELPEHEISHARDHGWERLTNGKFLSAAEAEDIKAIVTVDKGFRYKQNPVSRTVTVITLLPVLTSLSFLVPFVPKLRGVLSELRPGTFYVIEPDPD